MTTSELLDKDQSINAHRVLDSAQAAEFCGYSVHRWRQLHREGKTPRAVRINGGKLVFRLADLIAFNASRGKRGPLTLTEQLVRDQVASQMTAAQTALERLDIDKVLEALMRAMPLEQLSSMPMSVIWAAIEWARTVARSFQIKMFSDDINDPPVPQFADLILSDSHIWAVILDESADLFRDIFENGNLRLGYQHVDACIRQLRAKALINETAAQEGISEQFRDRLFERCKIATTPMNDVRPILLPHGFKI